MYGGERQNKLVDYSDWNENTLNDNSRLDIVDEKISELEPIDLKPPGYTYVKDM